MQIEPKVLFSVDATMYNGKRHSHLSKLKQVVDQLPTLQKVIVIPFDQQPSSSISDEFDSNWTLWNDFVNIVKPTTTTTISSSSSSELIFEQLPFSHPLYILFSSGTTGKPKCLIHSAGGMLLQHLKEHKIHQSLGKDDDVLFYYTTTGWMMWNWLVSALGVGSAIVLYEGSPLYPSPDVLWELVDKHRISAFGTSARYIQTLQDKGYYPKDHFLLSSLHSIYSTASPLKPDSFDFIYQHIKSNICVGSITGGTDICSLFCGANTALPVYRGEIQCRNLGMAIEALDSNGQPIYDKCGDMARMKPFPCMPVGLWNDPDNERYIKTYFGQYPGIWYHGDFILVNSQTKGGF